MFGAAASDDVVHRASPAPISAQHVPTRHRVQIALRCGATLPQRRGPRRREERMSEQQRVAIVTGAAGGIGRELVLGLLGKGLKVAAVDRTTQGLAELAQAV